MRTIDAYGYPAVGSACIFCGATTRRLTKEHIIARAIGGTVTIAGATCAHPHGIKSKVKTCQDITRDIEQFCFRNMLGYFRHRVGFPSSEHPTHLPVQIIDGKSGRVLEIRELPVKDHPAFFCVPVWETPALLGGASAKDTCDTWGFISDPNAVENVPEGAHVGFVQFHAMTYARMLAKIAHAFAVAERAFDDGEFAPLLPVFILGKSSFAPNLLMGCVEKDKPPEPDVLHRVRLETAQINNGPRVLVANIRLFAKFGAPQYHVVVGLPKLPMATASNSLASNSVSTQVLK